MTIGQVLKRYNKIEIELLLAHALNKPKEFVFLHPEKELTEKQRQNVEKLTKLRLQGHPLAYLVGYKDFYGLRFKVNKHVLIPRPETEWLIDRVPLQGHPVSRVLDLGAGSGAIIVSLAKRLQGHPIKPEFHASDVSPKALAIAKQNAKTHKVKINFHRSNLFSKIKGRFDVIIANLPYVPTADYRKLRSGLRFEPRGALLTTADFKIYKEFIKQLPPHAQRGALVLLEMDPKTKPYLQKWVKKNLPQWKIKFYKDFNGFWRYAELKGAPFS